MEKQNKSAVTPKAKKNTKKYFSVSFLIAFAVLFVLLITLSGLNKYLINYYTDPTAADTMTSSEKHFKHFLEQRKKRSLEDPKFREEVKGMASIDNWDFRTKKEKLIQLRESSGIKNCLPYQNAKYQYELYKKFLKEYEALNKTCSNAKPPKSGCIKEAENKYEQLKKFHNNLKNNILPNYKKDIDAWHTKQMLSYLASDILDMKRQYAGDENEYLANNEAENRQRAEEIVENQNFIKDFIVGMFQGDVVDEGFKNKNVKYKSYASEIDTFDRAMIIKAVLYRLEQSQRNEFDRKFQKEAQKLLINSKLNNAEANEAILPMADKKIIDVFFKTVNTELKIANFICLLTFN